MIGRIGLDHPFPLALSGSDGAVEQLTTGVSVPSEWNGCTIASTFYAHHQTVSLSPQPSWWAAWAQSIFD